MSRRKSSRKPLIISKTACCFCNLTEDDELKYGKLYKYNEILTHYYCLLLSSNMEQKGEDDEGLLGFLLADIKKELRRGARLFCCYCGKKGATLGCCDLKCKRNFHLPCGLKSNSLHQFFGEFRSYCVSHRPTQEIDEHLKQSSNVICYICYDQLDPQDTINSLWAPCCKKNTWFHRKCVQQLALSAGYFFKCPLCNNNKEFQEAMQKFGIFIPSQDASWELEPNAYEELLYRYNNCDARKCVCSKGRRYTSRNPKWKIIVCKTCAAQGIHVECGALSSSSSASWDCEDCMSILEKSKINLRSNNTKSYRHCFTDSESDSDSDSDISVGNEETSLSDCISLSPLLTKLRPGPKSFKLQQLKAQKIFQKDEKSAIDFSCIISEKDESTDQSLTDSSVTSSLNDSEEFTLMNPDDEIQIVDIKEESDVIMDALNVISTDAQDDSSQNDTVMNIKITDVTSLSPEVFESSPHCTLLSLSKENLKRKSEVLEPFAKNLKKIRHDDLEISCISNKNNSQDEITEIFPEESIINSSIPNYLSNSKNYQKLTYTHCISNNNNINDEYQIISESNIIPQINSTCHGDAGTERLQRSRSRYPFRKHRSMPTLSGFNSNSSIRRYTRRNDFSGRSRNTESCYNTLEVTNNPTTCDRPRMISEHMKLSDLKFRISGQNQLKMILYDAFSVDINCDCEITKYDSKIQVSTHNSQLDEIKLFEDKENYSNYKNSIHTKLNLNETECNDIENLDNTDCLTKFNKNMISNDLIFSYLTNLNNTRAFSNSLNELGNETKRMIMDYAGCRVSIDLNKIRNVIESKCDLFPKNEIKSKNNLDILRKYIKSLKCP